MYVDNKYVNHVFIDNIRTILLTIYVRKTINNLLTLEERCGHLENLSIFEGFLRIAEVFYATVLTETILDKTKLD